MEHTPPAIVEEVVAVPERDTVSQVMAVSARMEAVVASLITATIENMGLEHVETPGKEPQA